MKILLKTHFREGEGEARPRYRKATRTSRGTAKKIFTPERIRWVVANLVPYKALGVDRVCPVLEEGIEPLISPLTKIFRSFLALGYEPEAWNIVRAMFIPKARKPSHVDVEDYMPISLTSFVLKTIETCID